ncbi:MAG TPA: hypothetical protein VJ891_04315 [Casimicrobiaceae bacterium]|nr:hypothetical protein [Casimicrobiaceae bacterium]
MRLPLAEVDRASADGDGQDAKRLVKRILIVEETKPRDTPLQ